MAEENTTPQEENFLQNLGGDFRMSGAGDLDPVNEDITRPAPVPVTGLPQMPGQSSAETLRKAQLTNNLVARGLISQEFFDPAGVEGLTMKDDINGTIDNDTIKNTLFKVQTEGLNVKTDPWKRGKTVMGDFHDPNNQNQFYDRYAAHSDFDKLGFSPFRDNESLYNANSSWWDEMGRAAGSWATLVGVGFSDVADKFGDLTDVQNAHLMEKAMATGSSTKGGIGGFTTNLFLNSGYTVGIMAELFAEELALAAVEAGLGFVTGASGGLASGATLPGMAAIAGLMAAKAGTALKKISNAYKSAKNLGKSIANLKDMEKARNFFNKSVKGIRDVVNPFENTVDFFKNADKLENVHQLVKTAKGFGEFYKDIRNIDLAVSEGALEGGMVQNQMVRDLTADFRAENGRLPNKAESEKIYSTALAAGRATGFYNTPLILLSNKMTFDGLVRGKFKNMGDEIIKVAGQKFMFNPKKAVKEAFEKQPSNWFKTKWNYIKNPRNLLKEGGLYTKANIAEGLQEIGQETLSATFTDEYNAMYQGDALRGGYYDFLGMQIPAIPSGTSLSKAIGHQISAQGAETFFSGFLMGGMVAPISNTVASTIQNKNELNNIYKRVFKNEEWQKIKAERDAKANEIVNKLNNFFYDPRRYLNADLENMQAQKEYQSAMKSAQQNNDKKSYNDALDGSMLDHVKTALHTGKFNTFIQRMEEMKNLSPEEIKEFDKTKSPEEFVQSLDQNIRKAKDIQKRYEYFQNKRPNPFNPTKYKEGTDEYNIEAERYAAWNLATDQAVYFQNTFDRALKRQTEVLEAAKQESGISSASYSEYSILFDSKNMAREVQLLEQELKGLDKNSKDKVVRDAYKEKEQKLKALTNHLDAIQDMLSNPGENESVPEEQYKKLDKSYKEYIKYINDKDNTYTNLDQENKSLDLLINYYKLDGRLRPAMDAVNKLLDPKGFQTSFERASELMKLRMLNRKAEIAESLKQYRDKQETNEMLNALADEGMFFDVSDLTKLEEEGIAPKEFYYTNTVGEKEDQVVRNTDDYMKAVGILQKYVDITKGIDITNDSRFKPYLGQARQKSENDNRTYENLAEQFGFDPKEPATKVPLRNVLEAVKDSEYSTKDEVELATKLLELVHDKEFVTFSNRESQPGNYTESAQTVIDARYSSENYKYGKDGHPLEHIILKEEIGRRVQEKIENDKAFADQLEALRQEALDNYVNLSEEEQLAFLPNKFNLIDAKEFAKAAMTNQRFQTYLGSVTSTTKTKTVWERFVDAVLTGLKEAFGIDVSGTVLNAALDLITAKINITPISAAETTTAEKTTTTPTTPVGRYTGTEIPEAVRKAQNPVTPRTTVNNLMQEALRALGYSEVQISKYRKGSVALVQNIIDNAITPEQQKAEAETSKKPDTERVKAALKLRKDISDMIQIVIDNMDYGVWRIIDSNLLDLIKEDAELFEETDYGKNQGKSAIEAVRDTMISLREEIAEKGVTFDELEIDDYVVLNNQRQSEAIVVGKSDDVLDVMFKNSGKVITIKAEDIPNKIKFNYRLAEKEMEETAPELTPEEKENVAQSMETAKTPAENMKAIIEEARNENEDDILNDIINSTCK